MPRQRPIQIEALTYSDSFETLVDRQFAGRAMHRAEDSGPYDIEAVIKRYRDNLLRSRQEYLPTRSGLTSRLQWASLCFRLNDDTFVTMFAKSNSVSRGEDEYKVSVTADSPAKAADVLAELRREFLPPEEKGGPVFFIMTGGRRLQRAPLDETHRLGPIRLALHYGEDFPLWDDEFQKSLSEPGISIFRGETGTGKTSFLRHVMCSLAHTHRFYFVPVDNFDLLSSGTLTDFWKAEQREHPSASKILVLEDAETLIMERDHHNHSPVSALLNITDGLITQFVKLHLICTLNCKMDDVDPALLRPGRLRFFKNFERLSRERALKLAQHYGFVLPEASDYSLAEVFASAGFTKHTAGAVKKKGRVGFAK